MGIPSLNSAILYCVSLYFHISSRETSRHYANITNIPDLIHENVPFCGQKALFNVRVHENRSFYGREMKI